MSQHIFRQTRPGDGQLMEIQIGWDKPCQHFYFVVSAVIYDDDLKDEYLDDPILSYVYLPNMASVTLDDIADLLDSHGFRLPPLLLKNVADDRANNAGNKVVFYGD